MKKVITCMLLAIVAIIGLNMTVDAATRPASIQAGGQRRVADFIPGNSSQPVWFLQTSAGTPLFCEQRGIPFGANRAHNLHQELNTGFVHIIRNQPRTANRDRDYYVTQKAIWWFRDIINGNNANLPQAFKTFCTNNRNTNLVCRDILNLVDGARNFTQPRGTITFSTNNLTWTESGGFFTSTPITVTSANLTQWRGVTFVNAPTGTTVVNSNINANGNGTFQIRIPVSSVPHGTTRNFTIEANGNFNTSAVFSYRHTAAFQIVILDQVFTTSHAVRGSRAATITRAPQTTTRPISTTTTRPISTTTTRPISTTTTRPVSTTTTRPISTTTTRPISTTTTRPVSTTTTRPISTTTTRPISTTTTRPISTTTAPVNRNSLTIAKVNENGQPVSGAVLALYRGDCRNTTCHPNDRVGSTWTTTATPRVFHSLALGVYTIVEYHTPEGHLAAPKGIININSLTQHFHFNKVNETIPCEDRDVPIIKVDTNGNPLAGAVFVVRDASGRIVDRWTTTTQAHILTLAPGSYTLVEETAPGGFIASNVTIHFRVDENRNILQRNVHGQYSQVDRIVKVNEEMPGIVISKLNKISNAFVINAGLRIRDAQGNIVETWRTGNASHTVRLVPGEYTLEEYYAPAGYLRSAEVISFRILDSGQLQIRGEAGSWVNANGILFFNMPDDREDEVEVPKTGLSAALTYVFGSFVLVGGAWVLKKNGALKV